MRRKEDPRIIHSHFGCFYCSHFDTCFLLCQEVAQLRELYLPSAVWRILHSSSYLILPTDLGGKSSSPILQMEKLRPGQEEIRAGQEEIRAPDPSLRLWSWSHCKPKWQEERNWEPYQLPGSHCLTGLPRGPSGGGDSKITILIPFS